MRINLVFDLVKHQLIASKPLEQFVSSAGKSKNTLLNKVLRLLGIILIASSFIYLLGSNYFGYIKISKMLQIEKEGIAFCTFSSTLFLLFISTTYLEHTYFRGKDTKIWRLLPISKSEFYFAKFLANYAYSLLLNIIVTLPMIVAIFYYFGFSSLSVFSSFFLFFLLPIVPLVISSLLVILKITIFRGRSIKIVDFIFNNGPFIFGILYLSKSANQMTRLAFEGAAIDQLVALNNYIVSIGSLPYFSLMGSTFFKTYSLFSYILFTVAVFLLAAAIIAPLFEKCMNLITLANNNENKARKNINNKEFKFASNNLFLSLIKREFYILGSEKGFLSESISEMLIPIILIIVWQFSGSLEEISELIEEFSSSTYFIAIIYTIVHLFAAMVLISSTSVSREGHLFKLNKILPIDVKKIVKAKVAFHLIFITMIQIIYLIVFVVMFDINMINFIWMIPLFIINSINISLSGLFLDYSNPKLEWEVGVAAMKRNMNGAIGMLVGVLVIAPSILIVFFKLEFVLLAIIVSIIISFVFKKLTYKAANNILI
ncbi:MAG: hypothetical protein ACPKM0_06660 [Pleomorphochaeta sp.]